MFFFFFFKVTGPPPISPLSPSPPLPPPPRLDGWVTATQLRRNPDTSQIKVVLITARAQEEDRKSTRLNSSHSQISYAVFCLKKKKKRLTLYPPIYSRHHRDLPPPDSPSF